VDADKIKFDDPAAGKAASGHKVSKEEEES
jgi:hypothetical protein